MCRRRFHIDDSQYSVRRVGVAVSYELSGGRFTFVRSFQPDGFPSLDMSVYEDRVNGSVQGAYFVRSVDNSYVGISRLSDDYMDTTGLCSVIPEAREGHAIFHHNERYFMLTSHLTGWAANDMEAFVTGADSLQGAEWSVAGQSHGLQDDVRLAAGAGPPLLRQGRRSVLHLHGRPMGVAQPPQRFLHLAAHHHSP